MEVDEASKQLNGDKAVESATNHTKDSIGDLINEYKGESNLGSTDNLADGEAKSKQAEEKKDVVEKESSKNDVKAESELAEVKNKGVEKDASNDDRSSKRVRQGQRWNDRGNRFNSKPDQKTYQKNNKSDLTSQAESNDPIAIRKQVEFYFSDSNLLQDKFLFTKVKGHENLPVPISLLHSFKRMRHFQPLSAIVDALKESTTLEIVNDGACIRRKEPLPEGLVGKPMVEIQKVHEDQTMARSIYAKGFGDEEPSTQFDIEAFFANYGPTNSVRLRRDYTHSFKGSVFVEFDTEATQKAFLALDLNPKWQNNELMIKSKKQYCDDKVEDIKAGRVRPNENDDRDESNFKRNLKRRRDSPNYEKGGNSDEDDRDWRVRREDDRKSGFKGKHRGFGSSGRGRGGRNDRGRKGRNDDRETKTERGVPKVKTTAAESGDEASPHTSTPTKASKTEKSSLQPENEVMKTNEDGNKATEAADSLPSAVAGANEKENPTSIEPSSKKRAREEDDAPEGEASVKKVDTKGEES